MCIAVERLHSLDSTFRRNTEGNRLTFLLYMITDKPGEKKDAQRPEGKQHPIK